MKNSTTTKLLFEPIESEIPNTFKVRNAVGYERIISLVKYGHQSEIMLYGTKQKMTEGMIKKYFGDLTGKAVIEKLQSLNKKQDLKKFEIGNIYEMSFVGDSDLKPKFICIDRSPKFATFERYQGTERIKRKIKKGSDGIEYIVDGSYSMAPSINAKKTVG